MMKNLKKRASSHDKPNSLYLGVGSLRTMVPKTCSPDHRCTSMNGMK
jgi:hypothetical protein